MRAPGFWWREPGAAAALLAPLAAIYGAIVARRLARAGARAGIPVVCIGDPTVGGAGKTPTAIAVAELLIAAGRNPMFLTRGYGGSLAGPVLVEPSHAAAEVGDEPLLLARIAPTIVARDRVAGARLAQQKGAGFIVMDDGFQNPSLAKDISILVIDGARGIGNGRVVPAGPLRAPLGAQLARAQMLLVLGEATGATPVVATAHKREFPLLHATLALDPGAVASLRGKKVLAFAGIGHPEKFFSALAGAGIDAPIRRAFPDHHRYGAGEAAALIGQAETNGLQLVTTEKDLARMHGDANVAQLAARARAIPVKLANRDEFDRLIGGALAGR